MTSADNLAMILGRVGEHQAARELAEDTLARRRRVLGEDHPDTLTSAFILAGELSELGEYQAARELAEDILARRRRVLGEDHPDTGASAAFVFFLRTPRPVLKTIALDGLVLGRPRHGLRGCGRVRGHARRGRRDPRRPIVRPRAGAGSAPEA